LTKIGGDAAHFEPRQTLQILTTFASYLTDKIDSESRTKFWICVQRTKDHFGYSICMQKHIRYREAIKSTGKIDGSRKFQVVAQKNFILNDSELTFRNLLMEILNPKKMSLKSNLRVLSPEIIKISTDDTTNLHILRTTMDTLLRQFVVNVQNKLPEDQFNLTKEAKDKLSKNGFYFDLQNQSRGSTFVHDHHSDDKIIWDIVDQFRSRRPLSRYKRDDKSLSCFLQPGIGSSLVFQGQFIVSYVVLCPSIAGAAIGVPFILAPYILSPYVLGPFILSLLVASPVILSPAVLAPTILTPVVLSPCVLSPTVLSPTILVPALLSPIVMCPGALSPLILSPSVLSPAVLSPGDNLSPAILSPCLLC